MQAAGWRGMNLVKHRVGRVVSVLRGKAVPYTRPGSRSAIAKQRVAGVVEVGNIETQTEAQWRRVQGVVADGTFFGCKHAVRSMKQTGGGTIVNIASIASLQGEPYVLAYGAAKGAVEALTRAVAVHCAQMKYPIRCNSLHPGPIRTPLVKGLGRQFKEAIGAGMEVPAGLGAMNSYSAAPEEIATSVLYLASDASKWVNGTRLVVDHTMSVTSGTVPAPESKP